jgi:hypothetical protein
LILPWQPPSLRNWPATNASSAAKGETEAAEDSTTGIVLPPAIDSPKRNVGKSLVSALRIRDKYRIFI